MERTRGKYPRKTRLRHHAGSLWEIIRYAEDGDYRIRCIEGTIREGYIGGEVEGRAVQVHADYLHGDGWTLESCP